MWRATMSLWLSQRIGPRTVCERIGENNGLYSSNPRRVGIYSTYTWASRWASIHMGSIYSNIAIHELSLIVYAACCSKSHSGHIVQVLAIRFYQMQMLDHYQ